MIEFNRVYWQDTISFMQSIPDNQFDLIIADPPYNKSVEKWDKFTLKEYIDFIINCTKEYKRILSPKGNLFIYNQQPMASYMFQILYENLYYVDEIIWYYKNGGGNAKKKCKNVHQLLYWFSKSKEYIRNFDDIRQPYSGTRAIYKHNVDKNPAKAWTPNEKGAMPTNVWEISIVRQTEATPLAKLGVQKPLELSDRIIKLGSNKESLVYIPFAGSGSEIVSCIRNERKWVATESKKEYIDEIIYPRLNKLKCKFDLGRGYKMDRDNLINEVILYSNALSNLGVDTYQLLGEERVSRLEQMFEQLEESEEEVEKIIKQFEEKLLRTADELIKLI